MGHTPMYISRTYTSRFCQTSALRTARLKSAEANKSWDLFLADLPLRGELASVVVHADGPLGPFARRMTGRSFQKVITIFTLAEARAL